MDETKCVPSCPKLPAYLLLPWGFREVKRRQWGCETHGKAVVNAFLQPENQSPPSALAQPGNRHGLPPGPPRLCEEQTRQEG